jgi:hypothetical protein
MRIHHILPGFFILPTFQGHRGQTLKFLRSAPTLLNYWADLNQVFIMDTSKDISHITPVSDLTYFSMSQRSNFEFFMICSNALSKFTNHPMRMCGFWGFC